MRLHRLVGVLLAASLVAGCNNDEVPPAGPSLISNPETELFVGTLAAGSSSFYSFTTFQSSAVRITLASLTATTLHPALTTPIGLGVGVPRGIDCAMTSSVTTTAGLTAQIANGMEPGTYCVRIFDTGGLTGAADFAIRIDYPSSTPEATGTRTETFTSSLGVRGAASRSFTVSQGGTVSVRLETINPQPAVVVGLGVGIPRPDGSGCSLSRSVNTSAGSAAQITSGIDTGPYCVKIYDVGNLTALVNFSISIVHP
jgi:hypothetical protein